MMTIHVSKDVEDKIEAAVRSGRYASADEMIAKLVHEDALRRPRSLPCRARNGYECSMSGSIATPLGPSRSTTAEKPSTPAAANELPCGHQYFDPAC